MNNYAKAIADEMKRNEMPYQVHETDNNTIIESLFADSIAIEIFYEIGNDGDAKIVTYPLKNIGIEKKEVMREAIETLNWKYRFVKLYMENDHDICITHDFKFYGEDMESIGKHGVFTLIYIFKLISECLPVLLRAAYSEPELPVPLSFDDDDLFMDDFYLFEEDDIDDTV